ncbi:MAG TPA: polysaccharide biosynthesis/export family protein [Nitrospiria bacterium]|nr:polysaccharide biosynthesis/export family protein [Nitrospiria bacterium]
MKFSKTQRRTLLIVAASLLAVACRSMPSPSDSASKNDQSITDLRVMDLSDKTEIVVQGEKPITYTYLLLENPPRMVVNLLSMNRGSFTQAIKVDKGVIREINVHDGQNPHLAVQLEVLLNQSSKPDIRTQNNSLLIDFPRPQIDGQRVVDEYRIGPEDVLEIMVWKNADLTRTVTVRPDGKISLPLIGDVQASGLTTAELKTDVTRKMKDYIAAPEISILVTTINSYFYYITGEVAHPGKYPLKERTTVLQAISMAGGFTPFASKNGMSLFRKDPNNSAEVKLRVRYDDIISSEDPRKNLELQSGDTIVVP